MRLTELEPQFLVRTDDRHWSRTDDINRADGILFLCPVCFTNNHGSIGTHSCICWKPAVPQTTSPVPGRWNLEGTSYEDLTLTAGSSSILLTADCKAHFFIIKGEIKME